MQAEELAAFDEFGVARVVMRLDVEQVPAFSEDVVHRDDAGGLFIECEEAGGTRREARRVVLGDDLERTGGDGVAPELADVRLAADVFLDEDGAAFVDGEVVHHLRPRGAIEQHGGGASGCGIRWVIEVQVPEAALAGERCGGNEIEVVRAARVPAGIFGAVEVGRASGVAGGFQLCTGETGDVAEADAREAASGERGAVVFRDDARDLDAEKGAAAQAGRSDAVRRGALVADIDIDLAAGSVIFYIGGGYANLSTAAPSSGADSFAKITDFKPADGDRIALANGSYVLAKTIVRHVNEEFVLGPAITGLGLFLDRDRDGVFDDASSATPDDIIAIMEGFNPSTIPAIPDIIDFIQA